jgi:hypothetical protein
MRRPVKSVKNTKYLLGWTNIKWFLREMVLIYSSKSSFFSKKRMESGIGFVIAEWGMIFFLLKKYDVMSTADFGIWASIQFVVAGYMVNQIQKEKDHDDLNDPNEHPDSMNGNDPNEYNNNGDDLNDPR